MEPQFPGTPGQYPEQQPPGGSGLPEQGEALNDFEKLRVLRQGGAVLPGEDLIRDLESHDISKDGVGELRDIVDDVMAYMEGLQEERIIKPEDLDNDPALLRSLQNTFITKESSIQRPQAQYLEWAVTEKLNRPIREISQSPGTSTRRRNRAITEKAMLIKATNVDNLTDEQVVEQASKVVDAERARLAESKQELRQLHEHYEARKLLDIAYRQRQMSTESEESAAALIERGVTPDKGHWVAYFQHNPEFGQSVDAVMRKIVEYARDPNPDTNMYSKGFDNLTTFKAWMKDLLETAGGRLDVVKAAWQTAQTMELVSHFVAPERNGETSFPNPPIENSLIQWTAHFESSRRKEFNGPDGQKYVAKSGYPMSLGKFDEVLCGSYLHETKIDTGNGKKTLFQIWWDEGVSMADTGFPWDQTEVNRGAPGEPSPGSFSGWLLRRSRAAKVIADVRDTPSLGQLSDPNYFSSKVRNWGKIGVSFEARRHWVAGLMHAHNPNASKNVPLVQGHTELDYRTYLPKELLTKNKVGDSMGSLTSGDLLASATKCGFLREEDARWVATNLNLSYK